MLIDQIFPAIVGAKAPLRDRLAVAAKQRGLSDAQVQRLVALAPDPLIEAGTFLDIMTGMTGLWRYEFGLPHQVNGDLMWGTHMWVPVEHLLTALTVVDTRLPEEKRSPYLLRLANQLSHLSTLAEMIPAPKIDSGIALEFEVSGLGQGNRSIDWVVRPPTNQPILMDVKRRTADFFHYMEVLDERNADDQPSHDPALLFRSGENKFLDADPNEQMQGIWIFTDIKQNKPELHAAFEKLDGAKVHFAIIGDWRNDAYILARRPEDREALYKLFHLVESNRFTFE